MDYFLTIRWHSIICTEILSFAFIGEMIQEITFGILATSTACLGWQLAHISIFQYSSELVAQLVPMLGSIQLRAQPLELNRTKIPSNKFHTNRSDQTDEMWMDNLRKKCCGRNLPSCHLFAALKPPHSFGYSNAPGVINHKNGLAFSRTT